MDLIDRRAAIEAIKNIKAIKGTSDDNILLIDKAEAQTELMMLPSAQTVTPCHLGSPCEYQNPDAKMPSVQPERKKGHWMLQEDRSKKLYGWHICSECGAWIGEPTNYCSNCGTDMRGNTNG